MIDKTFYEKIINFQEIIKNKSIKELKNMIEQTTLDYQILKNKQGIKRIKVFNQIYNSYIDLIDVDFMLACTSSHKASVKLFFSEKDLYLNLVSYAFKKGLIELPKINNEVTLDDNWTIVK